MHLTCVTLPDNPSLPLKNGRWEFFVSNQIIKTNVITTHGSICVRTECDCIQTGSSEGIRYMNGCRVKPSSTVQPVTCGASVDMAAHLLFLCQFSCSHIIADKCSQKALSSIQQPPFSVWPYTACSCQSASCHLWAKLNLWMEIKSQNKSAFSFIFFCLNFPVAKHNPLVIELQALILLTALLKWQWVQLFFLFF